MQYLNGLVTVDPDLVGGTPVFTGTRVLVKILLDYMDEENGLGDFLEDYPSVYKNQAVAFLQEITARINQGLLTDGDAHLA